MASLNNPNPSAYCYIGYAVAISGGRVVVGSVDDYTGAVNAGSAYAYDLGGSNPTLPAITWQNPNPAPNESFGNAVALSGDHLVLGAYEDNVGATDVGAAYLYDLASAAPTVATATLLNSAVPIREVFGGAVAMSANLLVVGERNNDGTSTDPDFGAAYVFDVDGGAPATPIAILKNPTPTPAAGEHFGTPVAISGTMVVVGDFMDSTGGYATGAAYVFDASRANPAVPLASLFNPTPAFADRFGSAVAVSGRYVIVGAYLDDTAGGNAGAAYVFDLSSATPTAPMRTLLNPNAPLYDLFGGAVAISGSRVAVGAVRTDGLSNRPGAVFISELAGPTPTLPLFILQHPSPYALDWFGVVVALSGDRVLVGGNNEVFAYDLGGLTPTAPMARLQNPNPVGSFYFGYSVSISGNRAVVGLPYDDRSAPDAGSAYVYHLAGSTPEAPMAVLLDPTPGQNDHFGTSVAVSGSRVLGGAPLDDTVHTDEGAGDVFAGPALTPLEDWRLAHFDNPKNIGAEADANDAEHDGAVNIVEFATYHDPMRPDGEIGALLTSGDTLHFNYQRAKAAVLDGLRFVVEWRDALDHGAWSNEGISESILSDDESVQEVLANLPRGSAGQRFVRLRIIAPQLLRASAPSPASR